MRVEFDSNHKLFVKAIDQIADKQLPKAQALALTETAKDATKQLREHAHNRFDNPVQFTARQDRRGKAPDAFSLLPADKRDRPITATVFVKDKQAGYLQFQNDGGVRRPGDVGTSKKAGAPIPVKMKTNKHGNLPGRKLQRFLSSASQGEDNLFVGQPKNHPRAPWGIYKRPKRSNGRLKLLVSYERRTRYNEIFEFSDQVTKAVREHLNNRFSEAFKRAIEKDLNRRLQRN
jgi:hypothetical protein